MIIDVYTHPAAVPFERTDPFGFPLMMSSEEKSREIALYKEAAALGGATDRDITRITTCYFICWSLASNGEDIVLEAGEFGLGFDVTLGESSVPLCEQSDVGFGASVSTPTLVGPSVYYNRGTDGDSEYGSGGSVGFLVSGGMSATVIEC